jgi:hypothetical protein
MQGTTQTQEPSTDPKQKRKENFPCMICGYNHYTNDFPIKDEVMKFLNGNSQPSVLIDAFLPQQQ